MSLEKLLVTDFIDKNVGYLENVESTLSSEGMSTNRRVRTICDVMQKGITFGLSKGGYILKCSQDKVKAAKDKAYKKWLTEIIYEINEDIEKIMQKNKYKK